MKHMMSVIGSAVLLVLTPLLSTGAAAATDGGAHSGSGYAERGSAHPSGGSAGPGAAHHGTGSYQSGRAAPGGSYHVGGSLPVRSVPGGSSRYAGPAYPHGGYAHAGYSGGTRVFIGGGVSAWPGWWGPGWGWGASYPAYEYSYGSPAVVVQPPPTEYSQQPPAPEYWYYCPNPQGYYPYVQGCSVAWVPVLPQ